MFRLVIFDLDGTITRPHLNFQEIKKQVGAAPDEAMTLLEYMDTLAPEERKRADRILAQHEREAAENSQLRDGIGELIESLRESGIRVAILTRNSRPSVETVLRKHSISVDLVVTRDDAPPKPSPEPVLRICRALGVPPQESLMVISATTFSRAVQPERKPYSFRTRARRQRSLQILLLKTSRR